MRKCLIVAVAIMVLTLAFASVAVAGPPPKGSCPDGFVLVEATEYPAADLDGDDWICRFALIEYLKLYIDNVIPPPFVP